MADRLRVSGAFAEPDSKNLRHLRLNFLSLLPSVPARGNPGI